MIQIVRNLGDDEEVYDLTETPDFLLVHFCEAILRHHDPRNPKVQNTLREFVDALRVKVDGNAKDAFTCTITYDREELNKIIETIDGLLAQFNNPPSG
jgi:hypothetical protein